MSATTRIEWADSTFNPWIGCTRVSPACDHCYAEAQMDTRLGRVQWGAGQPRSRTSAAYWKQPLRWNAQRFAVCRICGARGEFDYCGACSLNSIETRRRVFCASLSDVFDNEVTQAWRADLLDLIRLTPNLDWLLLTKRVGNVKWLIECAAKYARNTDRTDLAVWLYGWLFAGNIPLNIWLGATICNQAEADRDIPKLLATPAAKRFLSIEPMLGPIDLRHLLRYHNPSLNIDALTGCTTRGQLGMAPGECSIGVSSGKELPALDWVICGGESGPHARPMHPDLARSMRDQCAAAGVPFLFKQWGEWAPNEPRGGDCMQRVGKHAAGRLLDGREHSEWPA